MKLVSKSATDLVSSTKSREEEAPTFADHQLAKQDNLSKESREESISGSDGDLNPL